MNHEQCFKSSLLLFLLLLKSCFSIDTLTSNQTLADGELLVSKGETFALGFFSPSNSSYRYLGIWYNKIPELTVVWVANRDSPIINTTATLHLTGGNLGIRSPIRRNYWATNVTDAIRIVAQLLDSGNLVLLNNFTSTVLWQSFDHPTHTALAGMKLGIDRKTRRNWFLTSWNSRDDPGFGNFSYRFDPRGSPQLFLWKGPVQWWRTGPWNGLRLSGVPEMTDDVNFDAGFVDIQDESYLMYCTTNPFTIARLVLDEFGSLKLLTWHDTTIATWSAPNDRCDYYGQCGAYSNCNRDSGSDFECMCLPGYKPRSLPDWLLRDGSGGCVRKRVESSHAAMEKGS